MKGRQGQGACGRALARVGLRDDVGGIWRQRTVVCIIGRALFRERKAQAENHALYTGATKNRDSCKINAAKDRPRWGDSRKLFSWENLVEL